MKNLTLEELRPYYYPVKLTGISNPLFHISLNYNKYQSLNNEWNIYDEVIPHIYLGRIPENNNYPDRTKLIISAVTYGELAEIQFDYDYLESNGIRHLFINMEDFTSSVCNKSIINAIKLMQKYASENLNIYVHCKAGRSRSGMILAIYETYKKLKNK